jgi:hypothetical protein
MGQLECAFREGRIGHGTMERSEDPLIGQERFYIVLIQEEAIRFSGCVTTFRVQTVALRSLLYIQHSSEPESNHRSVKPDCRDNCLERGESVGQRFEMKRCGMAMILDKL